MEIFLKVTIDLGLSSRKKLFNYCLHFPNHVRNVIVNYAVNFIKMKTIKKKCVLQIDKFVKMVTFEFIVINNHINFLFSKKCPFGNRKVGNIT